MQLNYSNFYWAQNSKCDPIGRVFFADGRVFRAITQSASEDVQVFMDSELFKILIEKKYIPNTWVTNYVRLPEYAFVLEHEKLEDTRPIEWSFMMLKEAAKFTLMLIDLCNQYGYTIKDAHWGNIVFKCGQPVFLDFGSFVKGSKNTNWDRDFCIGQFVYLKMMNQGYGMMARSLMRGYGLRISYVLPVIGSFEENAILRNFVSEGFAYYDVYLKAKLPHIHIRSHFFVSIMNVFNRMAQKLTGKTYRNLIKIHPIYRHLSPTYIDSLSFPYKGKNFLPYEDENILKAISLLIDNNIRERGGSDIRKSFLQQCNVSQHKSPNSDKSR